MVSRFYSLDAANALVPELAVVTARLREQRDELVGVRDAYRDREGAVLRDVIEEVTRDDDADTDPELRRLQLRMRGIVDQMQADVAWLDERDIVLRDIATGLVDLPALVSGRQVWLCWRSGEDGDRLLAQRGRGVRRASPPPGPPRRDRTGLNARTPPGGDGRANAAGGPAAWRERRASGYLIVNGISSSALSKLRTRKT